MGALAIRVREGPSAQGTQYHRALAVAKAWRLWHSEALGLGERAARAGEAMRAWLEAKLGGSLQGLRQEAERRLNAMEQGARGGAWGRARQASGAMEGWREGLRVWSRAMRAAEGWEQGQARQGVSWWRMHTRARARQKRWMGTRVWARQQAAVGDAVRVWRQAAYDGSFSVLQGLRAVDRWRARGLEQAMTWWKGAGQRAQLGQRGVQAGRHSTGASGIMPGEASTPAVGGTAGMGGTARVYPDGAPEGEGGLLENPFEVFKVVVNEAGPPCEGRAWAGSGAEKGGPDTDVADTDVADTDVADTDVVKASLCAAWGLFEVSPPAMSPSPHARSLPCPHLRMPAPWRCLCCLCCPVLPCAHFFSPPDAGPLPPGHGPLPPGHGPLAGAHFPLRGALPIALPIALPPAEGPPAPHDHPVGATILHLAPKCPGELECLHLAPRGLHTLSHGCIHAEALGPGGPHIGGTSRGAEHSITQGGLVAQGREHPPALPEHGKLAAVRG